VTDTASTTAISFAPSELVVLFGDRFVPVAGLLGYKEEVLTSGTKVATDKLMNAAVGAALWAVHRSGAATLEIRQGKALFGLVKTQKLHVSRGGGPAEFPAHSLEAYIVEAAAAGPEVQKLLESYIGNEVSDPAGHTLGRIKAGMAERGVLEMEKRTSMKVFTTSHFVLPASTRAAAEGATLDPVHALLRGAEREPGLGKMVQGAIDGARVMMTESSD